MDIDWEIVPFERVGPLTPHTARVDVRRHLDEQPKVDQLFQSEETRDAFVEHGVHCYYDEGDRLVAVVLHIRDSTRCRWDGIPLLHEPIAEVVARLADEPFGREARRDPEDEFNGFTSALYEPYQVFLYSAPELDGRVSSVSVNLVRPDQ